MSTVERHLHLPLKPSERTRPNFNLIHKQNHLNSMNKYQYKPTSLLTPFPCRRVGVGYNEVVLCPRTPQGSTKSITRIDTKPRLSAVRKFVKIRAIRGKKRMKKTLSYFVGIKMENGRRNFTENFNQIIITAPEGAQKLNITC